MNNIMFVGDRVIWLQREVNWEVGQKVLVVTSAYKDELDNQNEMRTIIAVKKEYIDQGSSNYST